MQNKSEQLCKLLNIKPVYSMWINIGNIDSNYVKVTDKRYYKLISDHRSYFDDYNVCPEIIIEYIDFEKADNFVKLLELASKLPNFMIHNELCMHNQFAITSKYCSWVTGISLTICLIKFCIKRHLKLDSIQAQETEWAH